MAQGEGMSMGDELRINEDAVEWREVEGEVVALDVARSEYVAINETGTVLWRVLQAGATRDDLVSELVQAFEVDAETAARDVDAFLAALSERNLLLR